MSDGLHDIAMVGHSAYITTTPAISTGIHRDLRQKAAKQKTGKCPLRQF